jgi:hypothetical protein
MNRKSNSAAAAPSPNFASDDEASWLQAIQKATECVTSKGRPEKVEIIASLGYLDVLASILEQYSDEWDDAPPEDPPSFDDTQDYPVDTPFQREYHDPPASISVPSWNVNNSNRFGTFNDDTDDDDDDESGSDGEQKPPANPSRTSRPPSSTTLSMRRIMIRVVTAQSELFSCQALQAPPQWEQGAQLYQMSLLKIHHALSLADSECAKWLEQGEIPVALKDDANVVEVAIQYLTKQCDKFRQLAERKERQLMQRLEPQWKSRDDIKKKWGQERWTNNPRPKRNYAEIRAADEEQLRQIRAALQSLDDLDTEGAVESSQALKSQVTSGKKKKKNQPKRNNGLRPTDVSKRVPLSEYPDPTEFGWTFTGSHNNTVEFFENDDGVKLDWYFTTGTIKTSLDHPRKGRTQLFGARVAPNTYLDILLNPRAHTNKRYYNKQQQERKPSRDLWTPS